MAKSCKRHRRYPEFGCPLCEQALKALIKKVIK